MALRGLVLCSIACASGARPAPAEPTLLAMIDQLPGWLPPEFAGRALALTLGALLLIQLWWGQLLSGRRTAAMESEIRHVRAIYHSAGHPPTLEHMLHAANTLPAHQPIARLLLYRARREKGSKHSDAGRARRGWLANLSDFHAKFGNAGPADGTAVHAGGGSLSEEGLRLLLGRMTAEMPHIAELFRSRCDAAAAEWEAGDPGWRDALMTHAEWLDFCHDEQGGHSASELKGDVTLAAFAERLLSPANGAVDEEALTPSAAEMFELRRASLCDYWVSASHNSYLVGNQLGSDASADMYARLLLQSVRSLEIDCWDGKDGQPLVTHGHTLCSAVRFDEVARAIAAAAFVTSDAPLVLSLEMHCTAPQQARISELLVKHLGGALYPPPSDREHAEIPALHALRRRVLVRTRLAPKQKKSHKEAQIGARLAGLVSTWIPHAPGARAATPPPPEGGYADDDDSDNEEIEGRAFVTQAGGAPAGRAYGDGVGVDAGVTFVIEERDPPSVAVSPAASESDTASDVGALASSGHAKSRARNVVKAGARGVRALGHGIGHRLQSIGDEARRHTTKEPSSRPTARAPSRRIRSLPSPATLSMAELSTLTATGGSGGVARAGRASPPPTGHATQPEPSEPRRTDRSTESAAGRGSSEAPYLHPDLERVVSIAAGSFATFWDLGPQPSPFTLTSMAERRLTEISEAPRAAREREICEMQRRTAGRLVRMYPSGLRVGSDNPDPLLAWRCGVQHVALNLQTNDLPAQLARAFFVRDGRAGWVAKPAELRADPPRPWPPPRDSLRHVRLTLLSLHRLPTRAERRPALAAEPHYERVPALTGTHRPPSASAAGVCSPSVSVELHTIGGFTCVRTARPPAELDEVERRAPLSRSYTTPAVEGNGFNASLGGVDVHLLAAEPNETLLRVVVRDRGEAAAYEAAVLGGLRRGYRIFALRDRHGTLIDRCCLLVHVELGTAPHLWSDSSEPRSGASTPPAQGGPEPGIDLPNTARAAAGAVRDQLEAASRGMMLKVHPPRLPATS